MIFNRLDQAFSFGDSGRIVGLATIVFSGAALVLAIAIALRP